MALTQEEVFNLSDEEFDKEFSKAKQEALSNQEEPEQVLENTSEEIIEQKNQPQTEIQTEAESEKQEQEVESKEEPKQEITPNPVPQSYKIKANGIEYDFTLDELTQLASKGLDYTKKTQTLAPYRRVINTMQENKISEDDINLFIDAKKGNKNAIATLLKDAKIDVYDLPSNEEEIQYTPTQYGLSDEALAVNESINRLQYEPDYAQTREVFNNLDDFSKKYILSNPTYLEGLHKDVVDGTYAKIMPQAMKLAALDGYTNNMLSYYFQAGNAYFQSINEAEKLQQQELEKQKAIKAQQLNEARQAASLPKSRADKKTVTDYLDDADDDEAFNAWYKKLQAKY